MNMKCESNGNGISLVFWTPMGHVGYPWNTSCGTRGHLWDTLDTYGVHWTAMEYIIYVRGHLVLIV